MNSNSEVAVAIRRALAMGAAATTGLAVVPAVHAQDQGQSAEPAEQTVVVTGSRIRRVDTETASPVFVLDSTAIQASGVATAGALLQRIPAVAGAATNPQVNNGGGTGESNVELRGLSAQRTLVLLNGRRINILGQNGTTSAVDINMIPVNAIERVEVLKEGAGAIYGSDAIAGVVNFITRSDVEGAEATLQWGQTSESDGEKRQAGLLFGASTEKMSITVAANYNKQEAVSAGNRDFSRFALYLYGGEVSQGGSSRTPTGRIDIGDTPFEGTLPGQFDCSSLTRIADRPGTSTADYRCYEGSDAYNYQPLNLLITPQERAGLFTQFNYDFNDYVSLYGEVLYSHTTSGFQLASLPFDATQDDTIIAANSYYNPFGDSVLGPGNGITFGGVGGENPGFLTRLTALGNRRSDTSTNDSLVNAGFKGKVLDTGWEWDTNFSFGRKDQDQNISGYLLKSQLTNALGPSFFDPASGRVVCGTPGPGGTIISGCTPLNIFNPTDPSQVEALQGVSTNYRTNYTYRSKGASLNVNGSLFELPAGAAQLAVGFEYRDQQGVFSSDILTRSQPPLFLTCQLAGETCTGDNSARYNVKEYYAELFMPLLKDLPAVHALNVNLGIRRSEYSVASIGQSTNAQFKVEYRPINDILVRATYAEVFRAPTIVDLSLAATQDAPTFNDPCTNLTAAQFSANPNLAKACVGVPLTGDFSQPQKQITGLITGNANLKPEDGDVTTVGVVYDSSQIRGLSLSVDYWKYKLDNLITQVDPNFAAQQCVATGDDTFCGLMVRFDGGPNSGEFQVFREPIVNLGKLETDGIDFGVKYALRDTPAGSWNISVDLTRVNSYENTPGPGADPVEIAGTFNRQFGNYAKYRGLVGVGWKYFDLDALLTARYIHKLQITDPDGRLFNAPPIDIPSVTYFDLTIGYELPTKTHLQVGFLNLTDKQPPLFYQNNVLNANTDVSTYDTLGRQYFVGLLQKF
jgi:outer membrane receptor protein involved in Fe transport